MDSSLDRAIDKGWLELHESDPFTRFTRPARICLPDLEPAALHTVMSLSGRRTEESHMVVVYIEPRPKGRAEGTHIEDYVVEDHADHVLYTSRDQADAIAWSKKNDHSPRVARVRHLNDKKKPDHWRAV